MRALINTILATIATTTTAFAANGGTADNPGMLSWAFFGFCAVIIVFQMVPAVLLLIGAAKGLVMKPEETKTKA